MKRKAYNWTLPDEIEERLGEKTYGRQRTIFEKRHLLIILHTPPQADHNTREAKVFLRTPDGKLLCNGLDNGKVMLKKLLASYYEIFQECDSKYEKATSSDELFDILEQIIPINRAATNLYNTLQSARDLVKSDNFFISMRDESYELQRNFELLLSGIKIALDCRIARHAENQVIKSNEAVEEQRKLNILAAITFPLISIATIFGMNLLHGMEGKTPIIFWCFFATAFLIGLILKRWIMGKKPSVDK